MRVNLANPPYLCQELSKETQAPLLHLNRAWRGLTTTQGGYGILIPRNGFPIQNTRSRANVRDLLTLLSGTEG